VSAELKEAKRERGEGGRKRERAICLERFDYDKKDVRQGNKLVEIPFKFDV